MSFESWHWKRHWENFAMGVIILGIVVLVVVAIELIRIMEVWLSLNSGVE